MTKSINKIIIEFITKEIQVNTIYLYGSFVNGQFRDDSDIDCAVIPIEPVDSVTLFNLSCELGALLDRDVDLVDFSTITPVLKAEILRNNSVIFCNDDEFRLYNEMIALKEYSLLNEERNIILKEIYGYCFE